jgi:TrmH family RNA methyltransferase
VSVELSGFHAVKHALRFAPELVTEVVVTSFEEAERLCRRLAPDVAEPLLSLAAEGEVDHPTGVAGRAQLPPADRSCLTRRNAPLVVLDAPRHAGNAGAAIRVAAAAGASGVAFLTDPRAPLDPWHPAVVRGSAGLHYALPVLQLGSLAHLHGPVIVLDADGDPWPGLPANAAFVVGSERAGVSEEALSRADQVVALPMRPGVSSLNLGTAVSAALYAWRLGAGAASPPG